MIEVIFRLKNGRTTIGVVHATIRQADVATLEHLWVDPSARRQGHASRLMAMVTPALRKHGVVVLYTHPSPGTWDSQTKEIVALQRSAVGYAAYEQAEKEVRAWCVKDGFVEVPDEELNEVVGFGTWRRPL
jgi:GNAT superfamily N-acetyltransferase